MVPAGNSMSLPSVAAITPPAPMVAPMIAPFTLRSARRPPRPRPRQFNGLHFVANAAALMHLRRHRANRMVTAVHVDLIERERQPPVRSMFPAFVTLLTTPRTMEPAGIRMVFPCITSTAVVASNRCSVVAVARLSAVCNRTSSS